MQLHEIKPTKARKTVKRIARGGKRGKTSGRGGKGQTARSGTSGRPEMRDIIKKLPKLRGHGKNRAKTVNNERVLPIVVNVALLEATFEVDAAINPTTLVRMGVINAKSKKAPKVKILGTGDVTKKFTVTGCEVSKTAKEKIEKAGGTIV